MPYEYHQERAYPVSAQTVYDASMKVIEKLSGKVIATTPDKWRVETNFPKVVLGKTLGERCYCCIEVQPEGDGSKLILDAYPLDALNRKLMFGARKGVTQTVVTWFIAHLEHTLGIPQS